MSHDSGEKMENSLLLQKRFYVAHLVPNFALKNIKHLKFLSCFYKKMTTTAVVLYNLDHLFDMLMYFVKIGGLVNLS